MNKSVRLTARLAGILVAGLLAANAVAQPIITSLAPTNAAAGATVVISGTGFATSVTQNAVYFGTARAAVTAATTTQLTVQVPVGASSITPVTVTDLTNRQVGSSLSSATPVFTLRFTGAALNANSYQVINYPVGMSRTGQSGIAAADFNADNYADFAVVADGALLLVLSDGQGGYDPAITLAAGTRPGYVKAADVDANGAADLLVGASGQLLLLRNLGNGNGFASATALNLSGERFTTGAATGGSVDVQDMNADGLPDLVAVITNGALAFGEQLVELRNNGSGFNAPSVLLSGQLYGQVVADFNQDSRLDVAVIGDDFPKSIIYIARNATNTGYAAPESTSIGNNGSVLFGVPQATDVNYDGRPDLLLNGRLNGTDGIIAALRTATGFSFTLASTNTSNSLQPVADVDGDGLTDILVVDFNNFYVLRGLSSGGFSQPSSYGPVGSNLVTGDFNNDGRSDLAVFNLASGNLTIFRYTGAGANTNNAPTLNALSDLTLTEDDAQQNIALSGISNGGDAGQAVTLTAVSSDPSLVPNPTISYFSPTSTGTLRLRPAPNAFGTCTITVTASDGQAQNGTFSRTFQVTVGAVNDPPTLDAIPDLVLTQPTSPITIPLSGINSGAVNENDILSLSAIFTVTASVGGLNSGVFTYTSPSVSAVYQPPFSVGTAPFSTPGLIATVTITVSDGQSTNNTTSRTFRIYYNPGGVNPNQPSVAPLLDPIADVTANRALAIQTPVSLAGIGDGDPNQVLPLTVTATSSDPTLVAVGPMNYTSPDATGSLPYTISTTRGGTATISVTVNNGQSQNGSVTRSFRITVPQVLGTSAYQPTVVKSMELYPNPAPGGHFWLKSETAGPADVTVIDVTGRVVWQRRLASLQQPQLLQFPAAATGMYLVRVRTATGTTTQRMAVE
ncbi:FG-GAP-like repeat-containing protein [uncultured Hymenobacter sp.]|uniref:FG-GAP-like repeat-containing protein n=1 Tax=uncultured Hymenobacter sp. TaxID=170016 RepID=UPI0035CA225F